MGCGLVMQLEKRGLRTSGLGAMTLRRSPHAFYMEPHILSRKETRPPRRLRKVAATVSECPVGPETNDYKQDDVKQQKLF